MVFCSTIIPTVGRSSLARAVESALSQNFPADAFEVLVINDSGSALPHAGWQKAPQVHVINTNKRERSVARNTGAAISRGKYLHFLDDDDWLAPDAYRHIQELSRASKAKWLYGITQLVDRRERPTIQLKHGLNGNCFLQTMAGEWIPLQSSWIEKSTFMRLGGFHPQLTGPEDIDLLRRVLLQEDCAETPHVVAYVVRGEEGSTTNYSQHSDASRAARESILDEPGAYSRMRASAVDPFWRARMLRIYLTSVVWNLQHRRVWRAASRSVFCAAALITAGASIFSKHFWGTIRKPYASVTFERGIREARRGQ